MQERVHPSRDDFLDVVVQHNPDQMSLGIGLEPRVDITQKHFIDQIYGGVPQQTEIGRILIARLISEFAVFNRIDLQFKSKDEEADFYNDLGRAVLDAVTGSYADFSMWTWLDRPATNRLIRLLRKGRDSAFGRDE